MVVDFPSRDQGYLVVEGQLEMMGNSWKIGSPVGLPADSCNVQNFGFLQPQVSLVCLLPADYFRTRWVCDDLRVVAIGPVEKFSRCIRGSIPPR